MSRLIKTDDSVVNASSNPAFSAILEASLDRRGLLKGLGASLALGLAGGTVSQLAQAANAAPTAPLSLGFTGLPFSTDDVVHVPAGYSTQVLYAWGDPVGVPGKQPAFKQDASNSAEEQALQAGMHHDGMAYFPLPFGSAHSKRGLLAINHEYTDDGLLHPGRALLQETAQQMRLAGA